MKKHIIIFSLAILTIFMLVLTACSVGEDMANEQDDELFLDASIGGHSRQCLIHSAYFCSSVFDEFISLDVVNLEDLSEWAQPLRDMRSSPYGECLVNILTFIEHFGISREVFQQVIDHYRLNHSMDFNLDLLYSGDRALIEEYYSIKNETMHRQLALEREVAYAHEKIREFQETVYRQTDPQFSRYYYDLWTFAWFYPDMPKIGIYRWMKDFIEAEDYESINIHRLVTNKGFIEIGDEYFASQVLEHNMEIYTHYNLDILLSGDIELIESYYAKENEAYHTEQVQAAYEQYVAMYGVPDTSWMLSFAPSNGDADENTESEESKANQEEDVFEPSEATDIEPGAEADDSEQSDDSAQDAQDDSEEADVN